MPKGKKICPVCQAENGVRLRECVCGYEFSPKISQPVKQEVVSLPVKATVSLVRHEPTQKEMSLLEKNTYYFGRVFTPAGEPPIKPRGYKKNWIDGPASDEVVQEWAHDIYNHGNGSYTLNAVIYWAKYFWDVHSPEFTKIRELINSALQPQKKLNVVD